MSITVTVRPAAARALAAAAPAGPEPITSHDPAALAEGRSSGGPVSGSEMGHRGTWKIHQRTTVNPTRDITNAVTTNTSCWETPSACGTVVTIRLVSA